MYRVTESENNGRNETIVIQISVTRKQDGNLATMGTSHNDSLAGGSQSPRTIGMCLGNDLGDNGSRIMIGIVRYRLEMVGKGQD